MPFHTIWELAGAIGAALSGAGYYLWKRGSLAQWRERLGANEAVITDRLERIEAQNDRAFEKLGDVGDDVKTVEDKVDSVADTVYYLHVDDDRIENPGELSDALDVDAADDFLRGGDD